MVRFLDVDPNDVPNLRESHRGRVSYPILKSFLETGKPLAQLDRTGIQQSLQGLYSSLTAYIRNHQLPIKMFTRRGEIYLMRLDLDETGNPDPNYQMPGNNSRKPSPKASPELHDLSEDDIPAIDYEEALTKYEEEKGQVTK